MSDLHTQVLAAFLREGVKADDLPDSDPLKAKAQELGTAFTEAVDYLRRSFRNERIQKLAALAWPIIEHRIVQVALGPNVPSLSMGVLGNEANQRAYIFAPHAWLEEAKADPILQMGAVVFVISQAVDYHNQRLVRDQEGTVKRARAHEAEYLLTVDRLYPEHAPFNQYQQELLKALPEGLNTPTIKGLLYTPRQFEAPS